MHALSTATARSRVMRVTYHPAFSIVAPAGSAADTIGSTVVVVWKAKAYRIQ